MDLHFDLKDYLVECEVIEDIDSLDDDEFDELVETLDSDDEEIDLVLEKLSMVARRRRAMMMSRLSKRLQRAREKKEKRGVTKADIETRARRAAIKIIKNRLSRGRTDLSASEKEKIEAKLARMSKAIERLTRKQIQVVRAAAQTKKNKSTLPLAEPETK